MDAFKVRLKRWQLTLVILTTAIVGAGLFYRPLLSYGGLESPCTYISNLVASNPLSSDLASTSDDHLRCIKTAILGTFPNINNAVTVTDEQLNASTSTPELESATPRVLFDETDAAANERSWLLRSAAGVFNLTTATDAAPTTAVSDAIAVDRNGTTVTSIALTSTALTWNANTLFTTANDGSGSGLDADLLDGSSSAAFAQLSAANAFTNASNTFGGTGNSSTVVTLTSSSTGQTGIGLSVNGVEALCMVASASGSAGQCNMPAGEYGLQMFGSTILNIRATGGVRINGVDVTPVSSTYSCSPQGFTADPGGTCRYERVGNHVTLFIPTISGTSNATTFSLAGAPAVGSRPGRAQNFPIPVATDNGAATGISDNVVTANTDGTMTFRRNNNANGWTGSNTKGVTEFSITYIVN